MKKEDLIDVIDGISEENLIEGIALAEKAYFPVKKRKKKLIRAMSLSGVAALLLISLLLGVLLRKEDPVFSPPTAFPSESIPLISGSKIESLPDMRTPIRVNRSFSNGVNYIDFTTTEDMLTLCKYINTDRLVMPEYIPTRYKRTDCMPFQNMDNMVNIALIPDEIPLWLAAHLFSKFHQSDNGIALPDPNNLYLPTLPANFYCGMTYMLTGNYRVQVRSHYFTNGLFDAFSDRNEYDESILSAKEYIENNPDVTVRSSKTKEENGISQTITTYLENDIRYTRIESSFFANGKNFYTIETYPMPHIGAEFDVEVSHVYPESLVVYVEQDGLYGWFYLTQFGRIMTLEEISCLGLVAYQPKK
ncbi:MAG: hypothetical protein J6M12_00500 [Clostridia bacterium]|nr:hypothetical protein [Clostridia bacterium]